jgi:DNA helicase II / ATP-dependent DNA helicase PcrA
VLAGAGTGKTTVISHRAAYAVATGAVEARRMLLVTFTEKAAGEMVERLAGLGLHGVAARTFHSAALAQLRHFWPSRHDGEPLPEVMADKWRIVAPLARNLPGGYRFTPAKDLMDEIEWAKSRRLRPETYARAISAAGEGEGSGADGDGSGAPGRGAAGRTPPIPVELFVRVFRDYERARSRRGLIDFDDMLTLTVELLESDEAAAAAVRGRYSWFSVDECQDTSPLQQRLLELWLGDRRDLCVVGDEDQTIYTFAGGSPEFLTGFGRRFPDARVIPLLENHRSTPQVLELANRLIASTGRSKRLAATRPPGPEPQLRSFASAAAEEAAIVDRVRVLFASEGVPPGEIAVLVRLNAQIPAFEAALTRAGIAYRVRGQRFFERRDVRAGIDALRRLPDAATGEALADAARRLFGERLGFDPDAMVEGAEARERQAALSTLLSIVSEVAASARSVTSGPVPTGSATSTTPSREPGLVGREALLADLERRAEHEREGSADGVQLLTLHRAKGLEWDAVFLPALEEGLLPVAQAGDAEEALAEERRLLYVGITRARRHLWLSWAQARASASGRAGRRKPSRFLRALSADRAVGARRMTTPARPRAGAQGSGEQSAPGSAGQSAVDSGARDPAGEGVFEALRAWRLARASADKVPPYVIAHDATLTAIAAAFPRTLDELALVPGIGPAKLEKYGAEIVAILGDSGRGARARPEIDANPRLEPAWARPPSPRPVARSVAGGRPAVPRHLVDDDVPTRRHER